MFGNEHARFFATCKHIFIADQIGFVIVAITVIRTKQQETGDENRRRRGGTPALARGAQQELRPHQGPPVPGQRALGRDHAAGRERARPDDAPVPRRL